MDFFENAILIDTSAAIALLSPHDQFHDLAVDFFRSTSDYLWTVLYLTKYESYTRMRYHRDLKAALSIYYFLNDRKKHCFGFDAQDEGEAIKIVQKYKEHNISFHDALCAVVMKRKGIYKAFSFDRHFHIFGFEVFPGTTN